MNVTNVRVAKLTKVYSKSIKARTKDIEIDYSFAPFQAPLQYEGAVYVRATWEHRGSKEHH